MTRRGFLLALTAAFVVAGAAPPPPWRAIAAGQVLRGNFTQQRRIAGFNHPLLSSGDFVLAPGHGLIWRTRQPFAIVTVITPAGLVQTVDGAETTRLTAAKLPFLARLYDLLSSALDGDRHALDADFLVTEHRDAQDWELQLTPRTTSDSMPFRGITLRGAQFLNEVRIDGRDDSSDRLVFSAQALGNGLSPAEKTLLRQAGR